MSSLSPAVSIEVERFQTNPLISPAEKHYGLNDLDRKLEVFLDFDNDYFIDARISCPNASPVLPPFLY